MGAGKARGTESPLSSPSSDASERLLTDFGEWAVFMGCSCRTALSGRFVAPVFCDFLIFLSVTLLCESTPFTSRNMSQLATPPHASPPPQQAHLVSPVAAGVVCLSVFALVCAVLAYAAYHGRTFDPQTLAHEAAAQRDSSAAHVIRVESKPQQRP